MTSNYGRLRADIDRVVGQDIDHNELIEKLERILKEHPPDADVLEWHPISELKDIPRGTWVELRGPSIPPTIKSTGFGPPVVPLRGYTYFRRALPGPEGCV